MMVVVRFYCFLKKKVKLNESKNSEDYHPNLGELFLKAG